MIFLEFDPKDSRTVFAGGLRVWRTKDDGNSWQAVSSVLDGSPISAVEIAQANSKMVYIGTEKGGIYRSLDGGKYLERGPRKPRASGVYHHAHPDQSDQCSNRLCDGGEFRCPPRLPLQGQRVDLDRYRSRTVA